MQRAESRLNALQHRSHSDARHSGRSGKPQRPTKLKTTWRRRSASHNFYKNVSFLDSEITGSANSEVGQRKDT